MTTNAVSLMIQKVIKISQIVFTFIAKRITGLPISSLRY